MDTTTIRMAMALRLTPLITVVALLAACRSAAVRLPAGPAASVSAADARDARTGRRDECIVLDSAQRARRTGDVAAVIPELRGRDTVQARTASGARRSDRYPEYDVVLDVPNLCVDRITLAVDSLSARVELDARVANLLQIRAGADVRIGNVDLTIKGLEAQVLLLVDLDNVVYAIDQTLTFVDNNPEIVRHLVGVTAAGAQAVAGATTALRGAMLQRTPVADGQSILRTVTEGGQLLELTLSSTGQVVAERTVGTVLGLPLVNEIVTPIPDRIIRQVRDEASGVLVEYTLERAANRISRVRVIRPPDGAPR